MSLEDLKLILMGLKWMTMRKISDKHKIGGVYQVKLNLFDEYSFKVRILDKLLVNLDEMDEAEFNGIGYDKSSYLSHPYNINNPSSQRVKYVFEIVEINEARLKELNLL